MIKKINCLISFLLLILFVGCSFDKKTGIWSGNEEEKTRISNLKKEQKKQKEIIKIYSSENVFAKEVPAAKNISLTEPKTNSSWKMSGLNLQNSLGNIYLSGIENNFLKKKIGKNKFSISKVMSSPLFFNGNIIFADDAGTIFNINQKGKVNWKRNIYKKIYKKIYKILVFTINSNKIYIADNIGFVYAINASNGKMIWIKNHGIPIKSNIKVLMIKFF